MSKLGYKTVFVGYFPDYILKTLCKPHGTVLNITMMRGLNPETKGTSVADYALVEFKNWRQAKSAIKALDGYVFPFGHSDQRPLYANFSHKPLPEPRSLTAQENVFVKFGKRIFGRSTKVGRERELAQLSSDAQLFKLEDFDTESVAAVSVTLTKPEPAAAATFKKVAFFSVYIHEDTQKTIEYQEQITDPFSAPTERLSVEPIDDQHCVESMPPVQAVDQEVDITTKLQMDTDDFERVEETVDEIAEDTDEDVSMIQSSIGALETMVDVQKVELDLSSVATEIKNVNLEVDVIKATSVEQDEVMNEITARVEKLESTMLELVEDVEKIKRVVADRLLEKCSRCEPKNLRHMRMMVKPRLESL
ncbi:hypothetical protein HDU76_008387 [Blyttiomyces sp. JEL0837]|nr:hypothetical protein HDU76_008387 [Blyttiomyces sp. JEL0837]